MAVDDATSLHRYIATSLHRYIAAALHRYIYIAKTQGWSGPQEISAESKNQ